MCAGGEQTYCIPRAGVTKGRSYHVVLETEPDPLAEQPVPVTAEPALQATSSPSYSLKEYFISLMWVCCVGDE